MMMHVSRWMMVGAGLMGVVACAGARSSSGPATEQTSEAPSGDAGTSGEASGGAAAAEPKTADAGGMPCGEQQCQGATRFCTQDDAAAGGWRCAGEDDPAMFKNACLTKAQCGAAEECCAGMTTRCVDAGACDGGDTPLVACASEADCPESWYGMPVKGCTAGGNGLPGLKVCQVQ